MLMTTLSDTVSALRFQLKAALKKWLAGCIALHLQSFSITDSQTNTVAVMATEECNIILSEALLRLSALFAAGNLFNCTLERDLVTPTGP